ncbi:MAG: DUF4199 domain-containing protein [Bacteroidaceae bacterium]|nr:DUF4199 domain-containing protein [Bacteroidaceae bacterium]
MTRNDTLRQTNAFAMLDGLLFGIYWCFGFLCAVKGVGGGGLSTLGMMVIISAPFLGCYFARRFERQVRQDEPVGYGKAYLYSALLYLYASIILALAAYAYFHWLDGGNFVSSYIALQNAPEMQQALHESGMQDFFDNAVAQSGFSSLEEMLRSIGPADIAASLFNVNIFLGLLLSLPTALVGKTRSSDLNETNTK